MKIMQFEFGVEHTQTFSWNEGVICDNSDNMLYMPLLKVILDILPR